MASWFEFLRQWAQVEGFRRAVGHDAALAGRKVSSPVCWLSVDWLLHEPPTVFPRFEQRAAAGSDCCPRARVGVGGCQEADRGRVGLQGREIAVRSAAGAGGSRSTAGGLELEPRFGGCSGALYCRDYRDSRALGGRLEERRGG